MKKLLVLSGKGGTGKTTVAAALIHFAQVRAIADCDVDAPTPPDNAVACLTGTHLAYRLG